MNTSKLKLQKEKIADLIDPKVSKNAVDTHVGCASPTTTVLTIICA